MSKKKLLHILTRQERKRKPKIIPFLILSLLLHILILLGMYFLISPDFNKPKVAQQRKYIEITDVSIPKEKETEPPKETKRLAERSHKVEKETTKDDFTKRGSVAAIPQPQRKTPPKQKAEKKPEKSKKQEKKSPEKKVASLPKEYKKGISVPQKKPKKKKNITIKDLFSFPSQSSIASKPSRDFIGSRNIPQKEDTVDFNTTEFKYYSYFSKMKRQIEGVWNYPKASARRGEQGDLFVTFTIDNDGKLERVALVRSSLHRRLDDEVLRALKVAAPFPPFPQSWTLERLHVRAIFSYKLGFWSFAR